MLWYNCFITLKFRGEGHGKFIREVGTAAPHLYAINGGEVLNKADLSKQFQVSAKSIQRDFDTLRCFFSDGQSQYDLIYDSKANGYKLINKGSVFLDNDEILAVCKILLASRSMVKSEMEPILDKLASCCVPVENSKAVKELIANEK